MLVYAVILSFATWRISSLLYVESPFTWLRHWLRVEDDKATGARSVPTGIVGALFSCFWCMTLAVSFALTVATWAIVKLTLFDAFLVWMVSAAGALVLDVRYFARLRG